MEYACRFCKAGRKKTVLVEGGTIITYRCGSVLKVSYTGIDNYAQWINNCTEGHLV